MPSPASLLLEQLELARHPLADLPSNPSLNVAYEVVVHLGQVQKPFDFEGWSRVCNELLAVQTQSWHESLNPNLHNAQPKHTI